MAGEQKAGIAETVPADLKEDLKEDLVKENTIMQDWKIIQPALFFFLRIFHKWNIMRLRYLRNCNDRKSNDRK